LLLCLTLESFCSVTKASATERMRENFTERRLPSKIRQSVFKVDSFENGGTKAKYSLVIFPSGGWKKSVVSSLYEDGFVFWSHN